MTAEQTPQTEREPSLEQKVDMSYHTRLLYGRDSLNPDTQIDTNIFERNTLLSTIQTDAETNQMIARASHYERQNDPETSTKTVENWRTDMLRYLEDDFVGGTGNAQEKQARRAFLERLGVSAINQDNIQVFYNRYFSPENEENGVNTFIRDCFQQCTNTNGEFNLDQFNRKRKYMNALSSLFGVKMGEVVKDKLQAMADTMSAPTTTTEQAKKYVNVITQNTDAVRNSRQYQNLKYVYEHGQKRIETVIVTRDLVPNAMRFFEQNEIRTAPNPDNPIIERLRVDNPTIPRVIFDARIVRQNIENLVPYYEKVNNEIRLNPNANHSQELTAPDNRFEVAQQLSGDDYLRPLAAVLTQTPESQAKYYRLLTQSILEIHKNKPELLKKWLDVQERNQVSKETFIDTDLRLSRLGEKEELLARTHGNVDFANTPNLWKTRIQELINLMGSDDFDTKVQDYHYRWLDFLSRSINLDEVCLQIKQQCEAPAATTAVPAQPEPPVVDTQQPAGVINTNTSDAQPPAREPVVEPSIDDTAVPIVSQSTIPPPPNESGDLGQLPPSQNPNLGLVGDSTTEVQPFYENTGENRAGGIAPEPDEEAYDAIVMPDPKVSTGDPHLTAPPHGEGILGAQPGDRQDTYIGHAVGAVNTSPPPEPAHAPDEPAPGMMNGPLNETATVNQEGEAGRTTTVEATSDEPAEGPTTGEGPDTTTGRQTSGEELTEDQNG